MKGWICSTIGMAGSFLIGLLGGWDASLITLMTFIGVDFILGIICAGVFHKSTKSTTGSLDSKAGWKGLCKKVITIMMVAVGNTIDVYLGVEYVRNAVCVAFITNELISIIENVGLIGLPIPKVVRNAVELLKNHEKEEY